MAEPAAAKRETVAPVTININGGVPTPLNPSEPIGGSVNFNCLDKPYNVYTYNPAGNGINAFVGESNNYVPCNIGPNVFDFDASVVTPLPYVLTFEPNTTSSLRGAQSAPDTVRGTITITSSMSGK